jgi:hypothetical protein
MSDPDWQDIYTFTLTVVSVANSRYIHAFDTQFIVIILHVCFDFKIQAYISRVGILIWPLWHIYFQSRITYVASILISSREYCVVLNDQRDISNHEQRIHNRLNNADDTLVTDDPEVSATLLPVDKIMEVRCSIIIIKWL